jgi:elongation factor Ts
MTAISINENEGLLALNNIVCETDFVAANEKFVYFTKLFANLILEHKDEIQKEDYDTLKIDKYFNNVDSEIKGLTINECVKYLISKTGENCQIKNLLLHKFNPENEVVGIYLHNTVGENIGKKAAFVILQSEGKMSENQRKKFKELADQVAMQIIASKPKYLNRSEISEEILHKESELIKEGIIAMTKDSSIQSKNDDTDYSSLSEEKLNKLINRKIENWIESNCLNEQEFVIIDHDAKNSNEKVINIVSKRSKNFGVINGKIKEFRSFL